MVICFFLDMVGVQFYLEVDFEGMIVYFIEFECCEVVIIEYGVEKYYCMLSDMCYFCCIMYIYSCVLFQFIE